MELYKFVGFLKNHWRAISVFIIFFVLILVVRQYSFITVKVEGGAGGQEFTYQFTDQANNKVTELKSKSSSIKKLMRKGSYELLVKQSAGNYFSVTKIGGFLSSKTISAELKAERARQFMGDNPGTCMFYDTTLYSYSCGSSYSDIKIHTPANASQPTYTANNPNDNTGSVEGIIKTNEGAIALIGLVGSEDTSDAHTAYLIKNGLVLNDGVALPDLDRDEIYSIKSYLNGFIVYNDTFSDVKYYSALRAKAEVISISKPRDESLFPFSLGIHGQDIFTAYSSDPDGELEGNIKTTVVVKDNAGSREFNFNVQQTPVVSLCGDKKLCLLESGSISVYDIGSDKARFLFKINGVSSVENTEKNLLVIRDGEIINLDVDAASGSIDYGFGEYKYCGLQADKDSYLLCIKNSQNNNSVLLINHSAHNVDSIDKKVAKLQSLPEIKNVSIYEKYIYISPDFGELAYQDALGEFGYDPTTIKTVGAKINQELGRVGINRKKYKVTVIGVE